MFARTIEEFGTVEVGKRADLIVVDGNPLEDIRAVRRLRMVLKGGKVVSSKLPTDHG